jgi:hypothetical protein
MRSSISKPSLVVLALLFVIAAATILLFWPAFHFYFFQDDWFSLLISNVGSIGDVLRFFLPRTDVVYYRPLGMQVPFYIAQSLFGINPMPFRVATLSIHFINGIFVFLFLRHFLKLKWLSILGAFFYLTSATHFTIFFWAATFAFVLAPFFYFSSLLSFVFGRKVVAWFLMFIGLFANELLVTLPAILTVLLLLQKKTKQISSLIPYYLLSLGYLGLRLQTNQFSNDQSYALVNSVSQLMRTLRNYYLWLFNWPETISDQFVKFFTLNPVFWAGFKTYVLAYLAITIIWFGLFLLLPLLLLAYRKQLKTVVPLSVFAIVFTIITLSPVLIFSHHAFSYYLPVPLVGIILLSLLLFQKALAKSSKTLKAGLLCLVITAWYFAAYQNIQLNLLVHWAPQRALKAQAIKTKITAAYPRLNDNASVFVGGGDEMKWALGDQNALWVLYHNTTIKTVYTNGTDPLHRLIRLDEK